MHENKLKGRQFGEIRRTKMLDWLREEGSERVSVFAEAFGVSEVTIRQDLEKLENDGHIVREHGGAFLKSVPDQVRSMALEHQENIDVKQKIGREAAKLVENGESIIIDSGSTTTAMASHLFGKKNVTVITNALNIALMLGAEPEFDVHMSGGHFKAPTLSLSGDRSADYFDGLFVQKLFLATAALDVDSGLTYPSLSDIAVKRAMMNSAKEIILLADSSKIGERSFCHLDHLKRISILITDCGIQEKDRIAIEEVGVEVIIAD